MFSKDRPVRPEPFMYTVRKLYMRAHPWEDEKGVMSALEAAAKFCSKKLDEEDCAIHDGVCEQLFLYLGGDQLDEPPELGGGRLAMKMEPVVWAVNHGLLWRPSRDRLPVAPPKDAVRVLSTFPHGLRMCLDVVCGRSAQSCIWSTTSCCGTTSTQLWWATPRFP